MNMNDIPVSVFTIEESFECTICGIYCELSLESSPDEWVVRMVNLDGHHSTVLYKDNRGDIQTIWTGLRSTLYM